MGVDGDGGRRAERTAFTFLHGLVDELFQLLGLVVLRLCLQQPSYILQGFFIFLHSGRMTHTPQNSIPPPTHQKGLSSAGPRALPSTSTPSLPPAPPSGVESTNYPNCVGLISQGR